LQLPLVSKGTQEFGLAKKPKNLNGTETEADMSS